MNGIITSFDLQILHIIHEFATPQLNIIFKVLTKATELKYIVPLLLLLIAYKRTRQIGLQIFLAELIQMALGVYFLKPLIARTRPFVVDPTIQLIIKAPSSYSCPSGHSGTAFAFAFALVFSNCPKYVKIFALMFAAVVGFSRLYLQVHFPTDVLLGAMLGCMCGFLSKLVMAKYNSTSR